MAANATASQGSGMGNLRWKKNGSRAKGGLRSPNTQLVNVPQLNDDNDIDTVDIIFLDQNIRDACTSNAAPVGGYPLDMSPLEACTYSMILRCLRLFPMIWYLVFTSVAPLLAHACLPQEEVGSQKWGVGSCVVSAMAEDLSSEASFLLRYRVRHGAGENCQVTVPQRGICSRQWIRANKEYMDFAGPHGCTSHNKNFSAYILEDQGVFQRDNHHVEQGSFQSKLKGMLIPKRP
ncbi:hypothetical protein RND71_003416 [Anisodus tanguticus]|uniref:Uncharacterized protein n=1 Tax=Anisodus tanguticus TaxID=243964 RepID=A0AAE1SWL6_9SOLA|nr:hypothetical protein RND71_003416 [Anisodus tanguticus]